MMLRRILCNTQSSVIASSHWPADTVKIDSFGSFRLEDPLLELTSDMYADDVSA